MVGWQTAPSCAPLKRFGARMGHADFNMWRERKKEERQRLVCLGLLEKHG